MCGRNGCQQDNERHKSASLNSDPEHQLGADSPEPWSTAPLPTKEENENHVTKNAAIPGAQYHLASMKRFSPWVSL